MGKKKGCDKKTFFDSFQALSPAFKLRTKGIDETYFYDDTKIRVLSYEPLNNRDLLLLLSLLAFCKPNGVVGIPEGLRSKNLSINNFPISLPESDEGSSQMRESQVS